MIHIEAIPLIVVLIIMYVSGVVLDIGCLYLAIENMVKNRCVLSKFFYGVSWIGEKIVNFSIYFAIFTLGMLIVAIVF